MKRAVVLTSQRTGSVFLQNCLNSHPDIQCYGEVLLGFGGLYEGKPPRLLHPYRRLRIAWQALVSGAALLPARTIRKVYAEEVKAEYVAFRLMYNQMQRDPRVERFMLGLEDLKVMHLTRRNTLKRYVSHVLMLKERKIGRKAAHTKYGLKPVQVEINPSSALTQLRKSKAQQERYRSLFSKYEITEIEYETMIDGSGIAKGVAGQICSFLGVQFSEMSSDLVKMNPNKLSEMVSNYEELAQFLNCTEFSELLD